MQNKASKKQACNLINRARKLGWSREVETMRFQNERPYSVQVILRGEEQGESYPLWGQIIVSFRRGRRASVSIRTLASYSSGKSQLGLWNATYIVNQLGSIVKPLDRAADVPS